MKHYVYQFLNTNNEIIYIGKTTNLKKRLQNQHFTLNSHLDLTVYFETERVLAAELISHEEMDIYERYLINVHSPKHNKMMNNSNSFRFELPDLEWKEYKVDMNRIYNQMANKIMNEVKKNESIVSFEVNDMDDAEANIPAGMNLTNKYGYRVVQNHLSPIMNLRLKRENNNDSNARKRLEANPFCRYIVVNGNKYFCINDIEEIISNRFFYNEHTRAMIKNETISAEDVLVLEDETLKERLHVGNGVSLRFGSGLWLNKRILRQLELNKRNGRFKGHKNGWTDELEYLAKELVDQRENEYLIA